MRGRTTVTTTLFVLACLGWQVLTHASLSYGELQNRVVCASCEGSADPGTNGVKSKPHAAAQRKSRASNADSAHKQSGKKQKESSEQDDDDQPQLLRTDLYDGFPRTPRPEGPEQLCDRFRPRPAPMLRGMGLRSHRVDWLVATSRCVATHHDVLAPPIRPHAPPYPC